MADLQKIETALRFVPQLARRRRERPMLHVMVLDDECITQHIVTKWLANHYRVSVCNSAADAISEYVDFVPDIVFLDINLGSGKYNGMDVLHSILDLDEEAYVVMLSGDASPENVAMATKLGARGFIAKPFNSHDLLAHTQECERLKRRRVK